MLALLIVLAAASAAAGFVRGLDTFLEVLVDDPCES